MLTEFGRQIRKLRIDRGIVLADMAKQLGVSSSYLSAIEHGKRKIPSEWIDKIQKLYNLSLSEQESLKAAMERSEQEVVLTLGESQERDELAVSFARVFENCDRETISNLREYLEKIQRKGNS